MTLAFPAYDQSCNKKLLSLRRNNLKDFLWKCGGYNNLWTSHTEVHSHTIKTDKEIHLFIHPCTPVIRNDPSYSFRSSSMVFIHTAAKFALFPTDFR